MENKFRGQRVYNGEMVYGLLFFSHSTGTWKITHSNGWLPSYNSPDEGESTEYTDIIYKTIGQFINIQDKNKVDIYSDDLLSDGKNIFRIYAVPGGFAMKAPAWMNDTSDLDLTDELILLPCAQTRSWLENSCERIGDIWQNPELVTIKNK